MVKRLRQAANEYPPPPPLFCTIWMVYPAAGFGSVFGSAELEGNPAAVWRTYSKRVLQGRASACLGDAGEGGRAYTPSLLGEPLLLQLPTYLAVANKLHVMFFLLLHQRID